MAGSSDTWRRRVQAAESAGRLLEELGLEPTRQVDPFAICESVGLWLVFMPLDNLLGAFVPEGSGGVLVTTQRPITVQRYTAAHELGHWRLDHGHGIALDGEEHVFGATPMERERLAQLFAANLLMSPPLVFSTLERLGTSGSEAIAPAHAYTLAREAGVSYQAAVRQLTNLEVISPKHQADLLGVRPLSIKTEMARGRRPVSGYADVWPVDEHWDDQIVPVRVDDEVLISLPENRSTGYRWIVEDDSVPTAVRPEPAPVTSTRPPRVGAEDLARLRDAIAGVPRAPRAALGRISRGGDSPGGGAAPTAPDGIDIVGDDYVPGWAPWARRRDARRIRVTVAGGASPATARQGDAAMDESEQPAVGATGRRLFGVRFGRAGPQTLRLRHASRYRGGEVLERYVLHALVEPRRDGFSMDQLADDPDAGWVAAARQRQVEAVLPELNDDDA